MGRAVAAAPLIFGVLSTASVLNSSNGPPGYRYIDECADKRSISLPRPASAGTRSVATSVPARRAHTAILSTTSTNIDECADKRSISLPRPASAGTRSVATSVPARRAHTAILSTTSTSVLIKDRYPCHGLHPPEHARWLHLFLPGGRTRRSSQRNAHPRPHTSIDSEGDYRQVFSSTMNFP
ncbi:hypothetical protein OPV22_009256 [Ensete ventricosum]|uniref:Secreted protein n=1 Tax=Ensete ventricosum TaxID=4639 RepID=A0AAV8RGJ3_ENSVE|nr:hypothetical protein OPV22_009256 [Ensete ventricosum]